jgi:hypothetical protein
MPGVRTTPTVSLFLNMPPCIRKEFGMGAIFSVMFLVFVLTVLGAITLLALWCIFI